MTLHSINKILAIYSKGLLDYCIQKNNAQNLLKLKYKFRTSKLSKPILTRLTAKFKLKAKKILVSQKGYRNQVIPVVLKNDEKICLIVYKNEQNIVDKIKAANFISDFLADKNFPTRQTLTDKLIKKSNVKNNSKPKKIKQKQLVLPKIIKFTTPTQTRYACFYTYLPGKTICWENYTQKHLKLLGKTMALMHQALAEVIVKNSHANTKSKVSLPLENSVLKKQILEMKSYFKQTKIKNALAKKLSIKVSDKIFDQFAKLNLCCQKLSKQQVLHLDFVRSNLLFDDSNVARLSRITTKTNCANSSTTQNNFSLDGLALTGILDFEKTAIGNPILDVARTLAFLLVDCKYKTQKQIVKYFLKSGYQKRGGGKLKKAELKLLSPLINYFLFYDFYKFLKHNPYENLEQNEHWKRTRERLKIKTMYSPRKIKTGIFID